MSWEAGRRWMQGLAVVGGLTLVVALTATVYLRKLVQGGFSTRSPPSRLEVAVARALRAWALTPRLKAIPNPVASTPAVLAQARAHWADHCATCHANDGSGNTELGRLMYPRTPDMRAPATQRLTDGELYAVIKNGIRLTGMPAWGSPGDQDLESWALVAFIRHLPKLTPAELREMESLNPKSRHELEEEQEEEDFLNSTDGAPASSPGKGTRP